MPRSEEVHAAGAGEGVGPAPAVALRSGERIARVPGVAIVYTNTYTGIPAAFVNLLANVPALHQTVVFITVRWGVALTSEAVMPSSNPSLLDNPIVETTCI